MTEALFRDDAYLTSTRARVVEVMDEGGVILDRTVFYPTGGGQPGDTGRLNWEGGSCEITATVKGDGDAIVHVAGVGAILPPVGAEVTAEIDAETRALYRRVHTCLHLLSVVVPLPVTGGSISAGKGRLDFDMPEPPEDKEAFAIALNAFIEADHPVTDEWITDEELAANPGLVKTMKVKPPMGQGRVRLVRIGAGEATVDLQPCGGTHVQSTREIGRVRIGKIEKKSRQNRRVYVHLDE